MEEFKLYRDLYGNEFIEVAKNSTETFLAPVTASQYQDEPTQLHLDYSDIKVFETEQPGYYIKMKNLETTMEEDKIKTKHDSYQY